MVIDSGPTAGGTVHLYIEALDTFHPLYTNNPFVKMLTDNIFDPLFMINAQQLAEPVLADGYKASDTLMTWEFTLKKGVYFSNGIELTARDVCYTVNEIRSRRDSVYTSHVSNISKIEQTGVYSFRIELNKPDAYLNSRLIFPILKDGFLMDKGSKTIDSHTYIGTGIYRVESFKPEQEIVLGARTDEQLEKSFYLDKLRFVIYEETKDMVDECLLGNVDIALVHQGDFIQYARRSDLVLKEYII